jgi:hypothetical protein
MHGIATQAQSRSHDCFFPRRHFVDTRLISSRLIFAHVTVEGVFFYYLFFLDIYGSFRYVLVWFCDRRRVFVARRLFSILRLGLRFSRVVGLLSICSSLLPLRWGGYLPSRGPLAGFRGRLAGWGAHTGVDFDLHSGALGPLGPGKRGRELADMHIPALRCGSCHATHTLFLRAF